MALRKGNGLGTRGESASRSLTALILFLSFLATPASAVRVALVRGYPGPDDLAVADELHNNWQQYGDIEVEIDRTLQDDDDFTYDDLVGTGADVIWLSNPAGSEEEYTPEQIEAIKQYVTEGHDLFGTFRVFKFDEYDNRELAPLFGLPETHYNIASVTASQTFDLLNAGHPLFVNVPDPYVSMGFNRAQVPNNDGSWGIGDFGMTTLLAKTSDNRGVITYFEAEAYHAVYVSELVENVDKPQGAADTQFLYNVLTLGATPTGECCAGEGGCEVVEEADCFGPWTEGGTCDPNPCPQLGACCSGGCFTSFEDDCDLPGQRWTEGLDCSTDSDNDFVIDACDICPGFNDLVDADLDGTPNGCDLCPGSDDRQDDDGDGAPDGCDACPGFDDNDDDDNDNVPDGCDICPGFDDGLDCDSDKTPDGCDDEPDCNSNLIPDNCDVNDGSGDCDNNGVPDECQSDSDGDRVIDPCDTCIGDDTLIGDPCDSTVDADDCVTGVYDCSSGTLVCTDGPAIDGPDTDGDGVYDCNDLCNNTPPGVVILPNGCRPMGACCFTSGVCFDEVASEDCDAIGGDLLGLNLTCDGDPDTDETFGCDDGCPMDGNKTEPGECGCGRPDTDTDGDDTADCLDDCPEDPNKTEPGLCGCNVSDADSDGDGTINCQDGCPTDPNKTSPGVCGCNVPDADTDGDTVLNCQDGCPNDPNKTSPGVCGCHVPDVDSDGDGTLNCGDECPNDPAKITPGHCGCGVVEDDSDDDGDGVIACFDLCPGTPAEDPVDEDGCPTHGACCFQAGGGVCIPDASFPACTVTGGRYQGNGSICAEGCFHPNNGDINGDGEVNIADLPHLTECLLGPGAGYALPNCDAYDFDDDGDVDASDVADFQNAVGD